jgi:catechol 2,3-dioxygenase-like lactoylglutathione lyase family enzyme
MPRIRRVLETALYCEHLSRTAKFYRELLGGEPLLESERLVALDAGEGTVLLLFQRGQSSIPLSTPGGFIPAHDGSGPSHLAFAIEAAEVSDWEARLAGLGVDIESRVTWGRGGRSLYFRDPDGRSVELATPGTWATY